MQIKTKMRSYLPPIRMAITKKTKDNKCWWGCGGKGTLKLGWWECKLAWPLQKTIWRLLKKIKDKSTMWSSNSISGHIPKGNENRISTRYMRPSWLSQHYSQQPRYGNSPTPINRWIDKRCNTQWNITQPWERRISSIWDNMDRPWAHYAKWDKSEKGKYCMIPFICGI